MPSLPARPFFALRFDVQFCYFALRFNDIPVLALDVSTSQAGAEFAVNPSMLTGRNTILLEMQSRRDEHDLEIALTDWRVHAKVELTVRPHGAPASEAVVLGGLEVSSGSLTGVESADEALLLAPLTDPLTLFESDAKQIVSRDVSVQVPFAPWLWTRCEPLTLDEQTSNEVLLAYRRFWSLMQAKDTDAVRAATTDNAREIAEAFFLPDVDAGHATLGLERLLTRSTVSLRPMKQGLQLELLADGRLARLVGKDGRSAIKVIDHELEAEGAIPLYYGRLPGRGWVQLR